MGRIRWNTQLLTPSEGRSMIREKFLVGGGADGLTESDQRELKALAFAGLLKRSVTRSFCSTYLAATASPQLLLCSMSRVGTKNVGFRTKNNPKNTI